MNPAQSARIVVICGMLEAFFVLARARRRSTARETTVKALWAIGAITLGLSALSDFAPQVAGPFAILILVALAARSRGDLGSVLGLSGSTATAPPVPSAGGAPPGVAGPQGTPSRTGVPGVTGPTPTTGREAPGVTR